MSTSDVDFFFTLVPSEGETVAVVDKAWSSHGLKSENNPVNPQVCVHVVHYTLGAICRVKVRRVNEEKSPRQNFFILHRACVASFARSRFPSFFSHSAVDSQRHTCAPRRNATQNRTDGVCF